MAKWLAPLHDTQVALVQSPVGAGPTIRWLFSVILPLGDTFSSTAIEIIDRFNICSSIIKGVPASRGTVPHRTWCTHF
jgi:hypothetical protein